MQKHVNLVDLVKSFPTNIYLQNLASIQKRTSPIKFAHLAEKSEKGSISNLSTKDATGQPGKHAGAGNPSAENEKLRKRYKVWRREHGAGLMKTRGFIICGDEAREVLQGFGPGASEPLRELVGPMLALPSFITNP